MQHFLATFGSFVILAMATYPDLFSLHSIPSQSICKYRQIYCFLNQGEKHGSFLKKEWQVGQRITELFVGSKSINCKDVWFPLTPGCQGQGFSPRLRLVLLP